MIAASTCIEEINGLHFHDDGCLKSEKIDNGFLLVLWKYSPLFEYI